MAFTMTMPKLSPTMEQGTITTWHVKEGDLIETDSLVMEVATDKATVEYHALDEGYVRKILVPEGEEARVNDAILILTETQDEPFEQVPTQPVTQAKQETKADATPEDPSVADSPEDFTTTQKDHEGQRIFASPLARVLASQRGIDLRQVTGTGPSGRIMQRDLEQFTSVHTLPTIAPTTQAAPCTTRVERVKASPMRRVIAKRLQESKQQIPHFYVKKTLDVTELMAVRQQVKSEGITVNDFMLKACALVLKDLPQMRCGYDQEHQEILEYGDVDISMAVDIEGGLITPIVFRADALSLKQLSQEAKRLIQKAREHKLEPHEYQGGVFTVSNLGMFGIDEFSAIVNPPQGAILAIGGAQERVDWNEGNLRVSQRMCVTLSVDHRVIDGSTAARFLQMLEQVVVAPMKLLLG